MPRQVTLTDVKLRGMELSWDSVALKVILVASYVVLDDQGNEHHQGRFDMPLSAGQQTTLRNFVTGQVIPAIKTSEGI